jgi:hypothetical protein
LCGMYSRNAISHWLMHCFFYNNFYFMFVLYVSSDSRTFVYNRLKKKIVERIGRVLAQLSSKPKSGYSLSSLGFEARASTHSLYEALADHSTATFSAVDWPSKHSKLSWDERITHSGN